MKEERGCTTSRREEIQRFVITIKRRRFVRETRKDTCLRLRIYAREHNSPSAIAHFTSSVLSRADYIRHTKQTFTTAPSSEFTCLFEFFPFFIFRFYIQKHSTPSICAHCYAEVFFNREYINWKYTQLF